MRHFLFVFFNEKIFATNIANWFVVELHPSLNMVNYILSNVPIFCKILLAFWWFGASPDIYSSSSIYYIAKFDYWSFFLFVSVYPSEDTTRLRKNEPGFTTDRKRIKQLLFPTFLAAYLCSNFILLYFFFCIYRRLGCQAHKDCSIVFDIFFFYPCESIFTIRAKFFEKLAQTPVTVWVEISERWWWPPYLNFKKSWND